MRCNNASIMRNDANIRTVVSNSIAVLNQTAQTHRKVNP